MMIKSDNHSVKLIDFGLADTFKVRRASMLIGNVRFCSRNAHFGVSSRKEDLESLLYVLYYLLTGTLPWQNSTR
jgi:serine/threonine protein kinase